MKKTRLYINGERQRDVYLGKTKFQVFKYKVKKFLKICAFVMSAGAIGTAMFWLGGVFNPALQYKTVEAVKEVESPSPVLQRIAGCESEGNPNAKGTQIDTNGQVLMRANTNKTVDVGKYQINTVYFAKATSLGYDITTEQGNEAMAMWIYKNKGTGDWSSSAKCWKK